MPTWSQGLLNPPRGKIINANQSWKTKNKRTHRNLKTFFYNAKLISSVLWKPIGKRIRCVWRHYLLCFTTGSGANVLRHLERLEIPTEILWQHCRHYFEQGNIKWKYECNSRRFSSGFVQTKALRFSIYMLKTFCKAMNA